VLAAGLALAGGVERVVGGAADTPAWLRAELGSAMVTATVRAALLLAELRLAVDDPDAALAATDRGLAVSPTHPGLYAARMWARAARGDWRLREWEAYRHAELADPWYRSGTDPHLLALRDHVASLEPREDDTR
jgi:hypothetical protein